MTATYRKCQHYESCGCIEQARRLEQTCNGNATESVNIHDPEYPDDPSRDRMYWVCSEHFQYHYRSDIIRE